ncbi:MAG: radical SAM protein [candidate division Zixibacteria bacterium]
MLKGIHFLLTYTCNYECDHCFLYCGPHAEGTFTSCQINEVLDEAKNLGTVEWIYFEGGEPFLYYPLLVEGLRLAGEAGFKKGVVTNCYWATNTDDAELWLKPLLENGIETLNLSDDAFHYGEEKDNSAKKAAEAASKLGLQPTPICIEKPSIKPPAEGKGEPVIGGGALFKGRAVEKLTNGLPTKPPGEFRECTREELIEPKRVHVDSFGNVHVCQGLSIGNMWEKPLSAIIREYDAAAHPICGPLSKGGPAELAQAHGITIEGEFVDECHYCYLVRRKLIDKFPEFLAPRQVYGFTEE